MLKSLQLTTSNLESLSQSSMVLFEQKVLHTFDVNCNNDFTIYTENVDEETIKVIRQKLQRHIYEMTDLTIKVIEA